MSTTVKIKSQTGSILEFPTLDNALRNLKGINPTGARFDKILLTSPSRRTFKEAHYLLTTNGFEIVREGAEAVPVRIEGTIEENGDLKIEVIGGQPEVEVDDAVESENQNEPSPDDEHFRYLAKRVAPFLDLEQKIEDIEKVVQDALKDHVKEVVIHNEETGEVKNIGAQHFQFEDLLAAIKARVNVLLVGPAGSGKTQSSHNVAKALDLNFYSISVGLQTTKTEFFGYMDATGKYVRTLFREAFEHGGVFLLDEMDAGNANVLTAINQALANEYCAFPDGMVEKHKDFIIIASANTYGTGANREYVGRNQLDAATLNRFVVIDWDYDEDIEGKICDNKDWLRFVRHCRGKAVEHKIRTVISPRDSIHGARLLKQGIPPKKVAKMVIYKGLNELEVSKLKENFSDASF